MNIHKEAVTRCRYCTEPLRHDWQSLSNPNNPGLVLVTCDNPECALKDCTFSLPSYYTKHLKDYIRTYSR